MKPKIPFRREHGIHPPPGSGMSRRRFMAVSAAAAAGGASARCGWFGQPARRTTVAVARVDGYERAKVRRAVEDLFDRLGGIRDIVHTGDRVAIKVNLTGGVIREGKLPFLPIESYFTHPEVARAVAELAVDAGAKKLFFVDGVFDGISYRETGFADIAKPLDAGLVDLNLPDPYPDYFRQPVGDRFQAYDAFLWNRLLGEVDAYISVAKMKCHQSTGITLTLKNNFGLPPVRFYDNPEKPQRIRAAFHGTMGESRTRLAKVICDINIARPTHLAVIDGIKTSEGGEGPWIKAFGLKRADVLIVGKDPVATDAVAASVMGFDPEAGDFQKPYVNSVNYLAMADRCRLGIHRMADIRVVGTDLKDVTVPFRPCEPSRGRKQLEGLEESAVEPVGKNGLAAVPFRATTGGKG